MTQKVIRKVTEKVIRKSDRKVTLKIIGEWNISNNGPIESLQQSLFLKMWETDTIADALQANV